MWRVQAIAGRVLHRYHGSSSLRLPQSHHVEDDVISCSAVLSSSRHSSDSSSQKEENGERRRKQRTFQFGYAELPRYTALDAVGWGAATVLFMQICRRIHSQFSSGAEPTPTPSTLAAPSTLHKCGYRILLEILSRRDVLPRGRSVSCLQGVPETQTQDQSPDTSSSSRTTSHSSSEPEQLTSGDSIVDQQGEFLLHDSFIAEESPQSASRPLPNDVNPNHTDKQEASEENMLSDEDGLAAAAMNLKHVGESSVPVILNIIGLESAKNENYQEAFACFLAAAQQGYSKAQFNTGVCYEKGRGVCKDKEKALHFYKLAALRGHKQAQYRYAKLLLTNRGQQSLVELDSAIVSLEQAAAAGLTKAQLCLASVYAQDPVRCAKKSIHYLQMAAESGDDSALLFLGQCYESGFGVQQNLRRAFDFYRQASQAGNKQAQRLLRPPDETHKDAALRSIRSAPCFSGVDLRLRQSLSSLASLVPPSAGRPATDPLLPHARSTGSLCAPLSSTLIHLQPPNTERGACQWTVGIG